MESGCADTLTLFNVEDTYIITAVTILTVEFYGTMIDNTGFINGFTR